MHLLFLFLSLLTLNSPFASISAPEVAFPSLSPEGTVKMLGFPALGVNCLSSDTSPFSSPFSRLRAAVAAGSAASPSPQLPRGGQSHSGHTNPQSGAGGGGGVLLRDLPPHGGSGAGRGRQRGRRVDHSVLLPLRDSNCGL